MSKLTEWWHGRKATGDMIDEFLPWLQQKGPDTSIAVRHGYFTEDGTPIWLAKALSYLGLQEVPGAGDNPVIINMAKGVGGEAEKNYKHDSVPWCKLFIIACLEQCGMRYDDSLWALDSVNWGQKLLGPCVGALAVLKRSGGGHVTWVVGRDQHGNVMCCGGNQNDEVNIKPFDPDRVVAWRYPIEVPKPSAVGMGALPFVTSDGIVSTNEA